MIPQEIAERIMNRIRSLVDRDEEITAACAELQSSYGGTGISIEIDLDATIAVVKTVEADSEELTKRDENFLKGLRVSW